MHIKNLVLLFSVTLLGFSLYGFYKKLVVKQTDIFLKKWYILHFSIFIFFLFRQLIVGRTVGYGYWDYVLVAIFSFLFSVSLFYYKNKHNNYNKFWVGSMISIISSILIMQFIYIWCSNESKILFKFAVWEW